MAFKTVSFEDEKCRGRSYTASRAYHQGRLFRRTVPHLFTSSTAVDTLQQCLAFFLLPAFILPYIAFATLLVPCWIGKVFPSKLLYVCQMNKKRSNLRTDSGGNISNTEGSRTAIMVMVARSRMTSYGGPDHLALVLVGKIESRNMFLCLDNMVNCLYLHLTGQIFSEQTSSWMKLKLG